MAKNNKKAKSAKKKVAVGERGGTREGVRLGTVRVYWYDSALATAWGESDSEKKARAIAAAHWAKDWYADESHTTPPPPPCREKVVKTQVVSSSDLVALGFTP